MNISKFILVCLIVLLAVPVVFILQNLGSVSVVWLFWSIETRMAWLVLVTFAGGVLFGILLVWFFSLQRHVRHWLAGRL